MALIGEMQYLTIGGNTYSLPVGGGGTVTSVAVSNATNGGLSISGSPISSSGTITIGHSNVLAAAQTTQAVYPITIDKNGHISAYGTAVSIPTKVSDLTNDSGYITSYIDENVKQETVSSLNNKFYPVLFSTLNSTSNVTSGTYKTNSFTYNPSTNKLTVSNIQLGGIDSPGTLSVGYLSIIAPSTTTTNTITLPNATGTIALTSDIPDVSGFITTETDPVFSASAAAGITSSDISNWNAKVSDDKTWNGVELDKTGTTQSSTSYIPARSSTSATTAYQLIATTEPYSYRVAKWDDSAYLYSTTPSASDNSTKVATTAFVNSTVPTKTSDLTNDSGFINSIKTINNQSLIGSGDIEIQGGANVFIAEYDTTTYVEVKSAYDDDAVIICMVRDNDNVWVLQLTYYDDINDMFMFAEPYVQGCYWASVASDDTWNDGSFSFASTATATTSSNGLMSSTDKTKLDGIASGAEVNVQSNWSQSDSTADDYIKNKPDVTMWGGVTLEKDTTYGSNFYVPNFSSISASSAQLTYVTTTPSAGKIPRYDSSNYLISTTPSTNDNSTKVATTAYVNNVVPTKTSDLTNDSGFITSYTDEKLKTTAITADGSQRYFILDSNNDAASTKNRTTNALSYYLSTNNRSILAIGNGSSIKGQIRLYCGNGDSTGYSILQPGDNGSADVTLTLPNKTGTVALTSDIPTATSTPTASTIAKFDSAAHMNSTDMTSAEVSDFIDDLNVSPINFIDVFYPVGSYYETSNTSFNPNITWGGTWVLETEGQVHVSAGAGYVIGDVGGEATVTLTIDEMPSHNHTQNAHSHQIDNYVSSGASATWTADNVNKVHGYDHWTSSAQPYIQPTGGGQAHNNMQPYIVVNRWHRTA